MDRPLLDDPSLHRSEVVANNAMNRERGIAGPNSYTKDLGFDPVAFLTERLKRQRNVAWLDLCCGTGRALIQAADVLLQPASEGRVEIVGIDLVPMFDRIPPDIRGLQLVEAVAASWTPAGSFDLVTCVHGLHYVGDKLGLLRRAAGWLKDDGRLLAHLDPNNLRCRGDDRRRHPWQAALRRAGFPYLRHRHLIDLNGRTSMQNCRTATSAQTTRPVRTFPASPLSTPGMNLSSDKLIRASKFLSLLLRHQPETIGLKLDEYGWAQIEDLVRLTEKGPLRLTRALIEEVVASNDKKRFVLSDDGARIRAAQGHSVEVDLALPPREPPEYLYHGTATRFVQSILEGGILRGKRHHVHLSPDEETAVKVGQRHGKPVVLTIRSGEMWRGGIPFYCSENGVWLTDSVPPEYLHL